MAASDNKKTLEDILKLTKEVERPLESISNAIANMVVEAQALNQAFIGGRSRIEEMQTAIASSVASITKLGGNVSDVTNTMIGIADGSRRNVIATQEQVSKLFASSEILTSDAKTLTENFAKAGYEVSQIGTNVEKSIEYVQSLGLNARIVTKEVTENLDLMNRFSFNDGVQGLTKMAAQASMLRFDMRATKDFADRVLRPEGAIEMAAGFQRLGLAVGSLGDPFKLMNDAINDPGALQDSLIKATQQFISFSKETNSFKISQQGILTLKEMATLTDISYEQLTKSALAAADLDTRLSAINPSINFKSENDKILLANIASMGEGGTYEVNLKDNTKKELQNLNQEEFDELIKQQKEGPKTVEEIQRSQLGVLEEGNANTLGMLNQMRYGAAGAKEVVSNVVGLENIVRTVSREISNAGPDTKEVGKFVNESIDAFKTLMTKRQSGDITEQTFNTQFKLLEKKFIDLPEYISEKTSNVLTNIINSTKGTSSTENVFRSAMEEFKNVIDTGKIGSVKTKVKQIPNVGDASVFGASGTRTKQIAEISKGQEPAKSTFQKVDLGGVITIKIDAPPGVSVEYLNKTLTNLVNSESFIQQIVKMTKQVAPTEMKGTKQ
jgi:hypothetical protein